MEEIIISWKDIEEHLHNVDEILTILGEAVVTLNLKKCRFFSDSVDYLGHIIRPLEIDKSHTKPLRDEKPQTNRSAVRSFWGLCNIYRRFIEKFTGIDHPPNKLLRNGSPETFEVDEEQLKSFLTSVKKICSPPVLALPCLAYPIR